MTAVCMTRYKIYQFTNNNHSELELLHHLVTVHLSIAFMVSLFDVSGDAWRCSAPQCRTPNLNPCASLTSIMRSATFAPHVEGRSLPSTLVFDCLILHGRTTFEDRCANADEADGEPNRCAKSLFRGSCHG